MKKRLLLLSSVLVALVALGSTSITTEAKNSPKVIEVGKDTKTITQAIEAAESGDTILVPARVYKEQLYIDQEKSGITIKGENGTILDGSGIKPGRNTGTMVYINASNVTIENLEITGLYINKPSAKVAPIGIEVGESSCNVTISRCKIHDMGCKYVDDSENYNAHGILVSSDPDDNRHPISNIDILNCELYNLNLGQSETIAINGYVKGFEISGNYIHDCDNIGIDAIGYEHSTKNKNDTAKRGSIHDNTVVNISSDPATNVTYDCKCAGGIYVDGGQDIDIYDNFVMNCDIGIEVSCEHKGKNTRDINVTNNTLVNNDGYAGISIGGSDRRNGTAVDCRFSRNTVLNSENSCMVVQNASDATNVVENNLFIAANDAKVYSETLGRKSHGNTIKDNLANKNIQSGSNNQVINIDSVVVDDKNQLVTVETDAFITNNSSDSTVLPGGVED
ncbi:Right handed beta helix region [Pseudobutyrivibrio sp. 49]|uniref:right-handed parallel beta-helix repeat-containing protein n=1 Tax=unclassified Pseudobutyrivibrio TaxID=2638619 RepID=UPI00087F44AF|nr:MULTISPECIES: right-handed parallel beta-helix repeat-containing protein [unclassified Pseudobutyrivibrio]SDI32347.1 Right handed beta helix region [Pseudobutyrivibrio sp. 49]SFN82445.1 Right handed beta helix region [Pseudobutyrivibrio sp. UC1225]